MGKTTTERRRPPIVPPLCRRCLHFSGVVETEAEPGDLGLVPVCVAFPRGIPRPIRLGGVSHRSRYPGDAGILYEPAGDRAARGSRG